jgi:peptidoglycan/LPS O-acetylase OafA/YrhL
MSISGISKSEADPSRQAATIARAADRAGYIPALDGLRFCAAMLVAGAHYVIWVVQDQNVRTGVTEFLVTFSGLGMTLFFVLSGFVIHYTYHTMRETPNGLRNFVVARFARVYPLYIFFFALDFAWTYRIGKGSCGEAGAPEALLAALPYYLTLTQNWFYGVICTNSLNYQYGVVSSVTWSLSLEMFFYAAYLAMSGLFTRWPNRARFLGLAAAAYAALVIYLLLCRFYETTIEQAGLIAFGPAATNANGYQDSLIRWLYYFAPLPRLAEFIAGMAAAQMFLLRRDWPIGLRPETINALVIMAVVMLVLAHSWLYGVVAHQSSFIGRTASPLYGPLVAIAIYAVARWPDSALAALLAASPLVWLGEASYSIYLLHAYFYLAPRHFYGLGLNPWLLWALALVAIVMLSRVSFMLIERPSRIAIKRWLAREPAALG